MKIGFGYISLQKFMTRSRTVRKLNNANQTLHFYSSWMFKVNVPFSPARGFSELSGILLS